MTVEGYEVAAFRTASNTEGVSGEIATLKIDGNRYPEAAAHASDAMASGVSGEGVINRSGAAGRRAEALKDVKPVRGFDRDEFPPAFINNGKQGSSVRLISPSDNRGAGASLGNQAKNLPDNTRVKIEVILPNKKKPR